MSQTSHSNKKTIKAAPGDQLLGSFMAAGEEGCRGTIEWILGVPVLTIECGSVVYQLSHVVVDFEKMKEDTYCLSWMGTAVGRLNDSEFCTRSVTHTAFGNQTNDCEFKDGTFRPDRICLVLSTNSGPTEFEYCPIKQSDIKKWWQAQ